MATTSSTSRLNRAVSSLATLLKQSVYWPGKQVDSVSKQAPAKVMMAVVCLFKLTKLFSGQQVEQTHEQVSSIGCSPEWFTLFLILFALALV